MNNVCPKCGFPYDEGEKACRKCKSSFADIVQTALEGSDLPWPPGAEPRKQPQSQPSKHPSGSYVVLSSASPKPLGLDFSDEAPPGQAPAAMPSDLGKEVDLSGPTRIVRPISGAGPASDAPGEPLTVETDAIEIDPGAMLSGRSPISAPKTLSSILPGIPIRDSQIESAEESAEIEVTTAGFARRLIAAVVDLLLCGVVTAAAMTLGIAAFGRDPGMSSGLKDPAVFVGTLGPTALPLFLLIFMIYGFFFHFLTGRTPGKRLASTMALTTECGAMSVAGTALRSLASLFTLLTLGIGYLWIIVDDRGQALHDKIAGTLVVQDREINEKS